MIYRRGIRPKTVILTITGASKEQLSIEAKVKFTDNNTLVGTSVSGLLPPLPQELIDTCTQWKDNYLSWGKTHRYWQTRAIELPVHPSETNISIQYCDTLEKSLIEKFNAWLVVSEYLDLANVAKSLISNVIPSDYIDKPELISFIIQTNTSNSTLNLNLQKLPWHEWKWEDELDFTQVICGSGIALSTNTAPIIERQQHQLKAFVICGQYHELDNQIDLQPDLNALQKYLGNIVDLEIWECNSTTSKLQLFRKLDESTYHLLFFCGHSSSNNQIQLNDLEYISLDDLKFREILKKLKRKGLILAFFNSCDGLGIAGSLMSVGIPYVVVMKEPVHDRVAQEFIKDFLQEAVRPGIPIHIAVNKARNRLQWLEGLPHGEFLPVLFQNPQQPPFYINTTPEIIEPLLNPILEAIESPTLITPTKKSTSKIISRLLWFGIGLLMVVTLGIVSKNIHIGDHLSDKLVGRISTGEQRLIGSTENIDLDLAYQDFQSKNYDSSVSVFNKYLESDNKSKASNPEIVIFRNNAEAYNNFNKTGVKVLKVATSVPLRKNPSIAREILRGVAQYQTKYNHNSNHTQMVIVIGNDDNNSQLSMKIAEKFVQDPDIIAVIGHNASDASEAAAKIYNRQIVMLSPTSFSSELKKKDKADTTYRMVPQMTSFASQLAYFVKGSFLYNNLKVGICVDRTSPDNNSFQNEFNAILHGVSSKPIDLDCGDFNDIGTSQHQQIIIKKIIDNKINTVLVSPHINRLKPAINLMRSIKQHPQLKTVKLIGSPSFYTKNTSEMNQDKLLDGLVITVPYFPTERNKEFVMAFQNEWKIPLDDWRAPMSYAATAVIAQNLSSLPPNISHRMSMIKAMSQQYDASPALINKFSFNTDTGERIIKDTPGQLIQLDGTKFRLLD